MDEPHAVADAVRDRVVALRTGLTARGLDAGSATIAWHLGREGLPAPALSTISKRQVHTKSFVDLLHQTRRDNADAAADPVHGDRANLFGLCLRVLRQASCRRG